MKKTRTASLCEQGILLLIVLACSLIVRDTDTASQAIAEPARFGAPAVNAANAAHIAIAVERAALDSVTLSLAA